MKRLTLQDLTLRAGERTLCREITLDLHAGENWAVLGANGSGKTTLLHTIVGLRTPAGGAVALDGKQVEDWRPRERARQMAILLQDYALPFPTTALETVLTGRHPHLSRWAVEGADDIRKAREALDQVALSGCENRLVGTLSGGERRRLEIAAVLAQDAPICLWDEPANHLDLRHRTELLSKLAARAANPGHLNMFVLHDVNATLAFCSHTLLLFPDGSTRAGRSSEILTPESLRAVYGCTFRAIADGDTRYFVAE